MIMQIYSNPTTTAIPKSDLKKVHCNILSMMQILTYAVEGTQSVHVFNVLRVCLQSL